MGLRRRRTCGGYGAIVFICLGARRSALSLTSYAGGMAAQPTRLQLCDSAKIAQQSQAWLSWSWPTAIDTEGKLTWQPLTRLYTHLPCAGETSRIKSAQKTCSGGAALTAWVRRPSPLDSWKTVKTKSTDEPGDGRSHKQTAAEPHLHLYNAAWWTKMHDRGAPG